MSIYDRFEKFADKTFRDARDRYLAEYRGKDTRGPIIALDHVAPYIDHLRLIDVDDEALQAFKRERLAGTGPFDRPAMAGTVNRELTVVSTVLHAACGLWRWLPGTPRIRHVDGKKRAGYPLSWDEQERLFMLLPNGWTMGAALFAVNTGVRKMEMFGLRWSDLVELPELDTFVFVLRETKNGKARAVICNSLARKAVEHQRGNGSEFVFPRGRVNQQGRTWIVAWERAGLPTDPLVRRGIHNLRHTFAHRLRAAGVPEEDRNSLLGHNSHNLAQHYAMPDIARLAAAAELVTVRRDTTVIRSTHSSDRGRN